MSLRPLQNQFAGMLAKLIIHAQANGYELSLGEAWRTPQMAAEYAKQGKGIRNSLHCDRLAVDLNVFRDGQWLQIGEQFTDLGEYWESLGGSWGHRFKDSCHFSLSPDGKRK